MLVYWRPDNRHAFREILGTLTINSLLATHTEELKKKYLDVLLNAARTAQEMITA